MLGAMNTNGRPVHVRRRGPAPRPTGTRARVALGLVALAGLLGGATPAMAVRDALVKGVAIVREAADVEAPVVAIARNAESLRFLDEPAHGPFLRVETVAGQSGSLECGSISSGNIQ